MKIFQSSIFRAICAIAIGILLIKYPDNTVTWITVAIGILFLLSGLISLIVYVNARKHVSEYKITDAEGRAIVPISTARAGNVIGGGDFANDRIIPDCIRSVQKGEDIVVRNPYSTRPYQHVLEPLYAYLMIAARQYQDSKYAGWYNVGPDDVDCFQTGALVDLFVSKWGDGIKWVNRYDGGPHEANFLKLDCSKLKGTFGWKPRWNLSDAMDKIVEWSKCWLSGGDVRACMDRQIDEFLDGVAR